MANIGILIDSEEGHLYATFKFVKALKEQGHSMWYLGFPDSEEFVRSHGFEFAPVFGKQIGQRDKGARLPLSDLINGNAIDNVHRKVHLDGYLTLSLFCLEAITLRYRYDKPVVVLRNSVSSRPRAELLRARAIKQILQSGEGVLDLIQLLLRVGIAIGRFSDIGDLAAHHLPEVILYPRIFDCNETTTDKWSCYAGLMVDLGRREAAFDWGNVRCQDKIVYCSLGSRPHFAWDKSRRLFHLLIDAITSRNDIQLLLATGNGIDPKEFIRPNATNLHIAEWLPQLDVLQHADLMINHAGIGSVQECIVMGVPMIAFPLVNDQFLCAELMSQLGLGVRGEVGEASVERVSFLINEVLTNPCYKTNVVAARESIVKTTCKDAIDMVERALEGHECNLVCPTG